MKILLTNDDGIVAPGIEALARACAVLGEVTLVAPDKQQSGVGHRVTTERGMRVVELEERRYALHGSPADCTRVGLDRFVPDADWVIAGINRGGNLGADVYPSGTVAAAREATMLGRPAVAISQYVRRGGDLCWETTTARASRVLESLLARELEPGHFYNVNLPHPEDDAAPCEMVYCPVDFSPMDIRYREEGGELFYDGSYFGRPRRPGHDVDVCFSGSIAVSIIPLDLSPSAAPRDPR